jgi:hypothetical protein
MRGQLRVLGKLLFFCVIGFQPPLLAQTFLVSEAEMELSKAELHAFDARVPSPVGAPAIEVVEPDLSREVRSPTSISLRFKTADQVGVRPESFKVLYGAFELDITSRLLPLASISAAGITVKDAALPSGSHRLTVKIADRLGREGVQVLRFTVN